MEQRKLKRNLTLFEVAMYGVSFVIGTGVFLKPSGVLASTGSTGLSLLVWVLAGLISMSSALSIAEISAYIPKVGGLYTYLAEIFGDLVGFIYGWVTAIVSGPGGAAASAIAFATFSSAFIKMNSLQMKILSLSAIIFFAITQIISTKATMKLQVIGTFGKLLPIFAIVLIGIFKGGVTNPINFSLVGDISKNGGIGLAIVGALWAYDGWVAICSMGDELINANKNLPRAIIFSLSFVIVIYAIFNYVVFKNIPATEVINAKNVGIDTANVLFGSSGATLVTIGVMVSSVITLNAQMINNSRIILALAQRKLVPANKELSKIHPKRETPVNSIIAMAILSSIYVLWGTFESVTNMVVFVVWVFFVLTIIGLFRLRRQVARNKELYSVPLYPIIPLLGIIGGTYLIISTFIALPKLSMIGVGFAILGVPVFFYYDKKRKM